MRNSDDGGAPATARHIRVCERVLKLGWAMYIRRIDVFIHNQVSPVNLVVSIRTLFISMILIGDALACAGKSSSKHSRRRAYTHTALLALATSSSVHAGMLFLQVLMIAPLHHTLLQYSYFSFKLKPPTPARRAFSVQADGSTRSPS
ncbi:hypothetical protein EVAR_53864_1 [Eumeta japonica]|uniref:Uncharacterized protein n=1 Tax=Eumeta variegata TaxID=151549 RepID=A0A4C1XDZ1_EUMVA|nr:hypothetical protein EVAR_53864_1 [Eumeta japonica]